MYAILFYLSIPLIYATTGGGHNPTSVASSSSASNELGLTFDHQVNKREKNYVIIYFDVFNATLQQYRYYYYDFRPFGSLDESEYLPRQRLRDTHNSLRIIGLHEGDYVACLTFVDEYENIFKPRYACYEFTLGEKTVGSHHGSRSGYLAPLLFALAFILHVFIAIVHHIKEKNYAQTLLHRFINVTPKSSRRKINVKQSMRELNRELDHPHVPASVQRRLSRVTIDANYDNESNHPSTFLNNDSNDELPLYTLPHHHRTVSVNAMQAIPEYGNSDTLESVSSIKHLMDTTPWTKRVHTRRNSDLHV